ncbi:hypothetical protein EON65_33170 [archaeon]|nr:MAG: hypothetical protein EON65_33170 [archaeon]
MLKSQSNLADSSNEMESKDTEDACDENIPHCPNDIKCLLSFFILSEDSIKPTAQQLTIVLYIIEIVKILLHQASNRQSIDKVSLDLTVKAYTHYMQRKVWKVTTEIANIWINLFYTQSNTEMFVKDTKGLSCIVHSLVSVSHREVHLFCALLGALQAICYTPAGRHYFRLETEIIPIIASCMQAQDQRLQERAYATINNLSVDLISIPLILNTHCLPSIIQKSGQYTQPTACYAALGALTNLLRDDGCCARVGMDSILPPLLETLGRGTGECQVAALSCLLNLLGDGDGGIGDICDDVGGVCDGYADSVCDGVCDGATSSHANIVAKKKKVLHSILAEVLTLGSIMQCMT